MNETICLTLKELSEYSDASGYQASIFVLVSVLIMILIFWILREQC